MFRAIVFFAGVSGALMNDRDGADDDAGLQDALSSLGLHNGTQWTCGNAARAGYCMHRTPCRPAVRTNCKASCLLRGGDALNANKALQKRRLAATAVVTAVLTTINTVWDMYKTFSKEDPLPDCDYKRLVACVCRSGPKCTGPEVCDMGSKTCRLTCGNSKYGCGAGYQIDESKLLTFCKDSCSDAQCCQTTCADSNYECGYGYWKDESKQEAFCEEETCSDTECCQSVWLMWWVILLIILLPLCLIGGFVGTGIYLMKGGIARKRNKTRMVVATRAPTKVAMRVATRVPTRVATIVPTRAPTRAPTRVATKGSNARNKS
eukprot:GEMP01056248.1.p1 GENE.GEMP01056248.1~~GEMP01056248.1.p1  ORF type:complete len:342 (+),score=28.31 GEMP01056248.1:68-1027(+)